MDILKGGSISFSYMSETVGSHVFKNLNGDITLKLICVYLFKNNALDQILLTTATQSRRNCGTSTNNK